MTHKFKITLFILFTLLLSSAAAAQDDPFTLFPLVEIGQPLVGEYPGETGGSFSFIGEVGQVIEITVTSEDFEPIIYFTTLSFDELAYVEGSGGEAKAGPIELAEAGEYYLNVFSLDDSSGSFTILVENSTAAPLNSTATIEIGQLVSGELIPDGSAEYTFEGSAGQVLQATYLTSRYRPFSIRGT